MSFQQLSLNQILVNNLNDAGYQQATPIQQQAIPEILAGRDLMACAQTGTGKTAAFSLPILHLLSQAKHCKPKQIKALVLTPTRELAQQVHASLQTYSKHCELDSVLLYGGVSIEQQQQQLSASCDILVATPGRLLDHLNRGSCSLKNLAFLVLDEADRMLDMGFKDELKALLSFVPKQRQTLLFSATLDDSIYRFAKPLLRNPKQLEITKATSKAASIEERVYNVDSDKKTALLCHLIKQKNWQQSLVFCRTKQAVDKLVKQLTGQQINAASFHGDLSQAAREQVLAKFKIGEISALVATDVAARGLDIDELKYVINLELPFKSEDYIHRIGRTGRAGQTGTAVTLLSVEDEHLLSELEVQLDRRLPQQWFPGFEPDLTKPAPTNKRNSRSAQKKKARKRALSTTSKNRRS
ncbi:MULTISPECIES: DEAD/DEAH box helicase [unclassified Agarivorans]|uniref:DEAD/DEAH box helicase n=1 Tax=unclassified Agarivorans TaxID=2636026 RepID=UPI0026E1D041|nr:MULTISPECIES: DEAD/DEAH box helicase [unclassified Agarivorans]MDO6683938.1 DEAD/DEAH box helicase [Agarivorans sp. 3_MG-2023]MDO6714329.1 DEAD/DEAH box helicase [Agarivorans sp. 2_MG-2023]